MKSQKKILFSKKLFRLLMIHVIILFLYGCERKGTISPNVNSSGKIDEETDTIDVNEEDMIEEGIVDEGIYKIINKSTGRALNMQLSGMVDGALIQQYQEDDTMEFLWKVTKTGEYYSIQSLLTPRNMSVRKNSDQIGANIEVRVLDEEENPAQLWALRSINGSVQIISAKSGLTMGLPDDSIKTENLPKLLEFENSNYQLWQFEKVNVDEPLPYLLPVEGALFHSSCPQIIKHEEIYYMYIMAPHISIKTSTDLIHWTAAGTVFPGGDPSWFQEEVPGYGIWAPSVYKIKDKYYLYYCLSTIGSQNSAIGVAVNETLDITSPNYQWKDQGMVIRSYSGDEYNSIDPNIFIDDNGEVWLTFGSYWNGIYQRQIDPDTGLLLEENQELYHIAKRVANDKAVEAPYIIKRGEFYYLFTAFNKMDNTYHNRVSRSTSIHGPYYDRDGKPALEGGGTPISESLSALLKPGHASIFTDDNGQHYFVSEYFRKDSPSIMLIGTIVWDEDGWPSTALTPMQ